MKSIGQEPFRTGVAFLELAGKQTNFAGKFLEFANNM